MAHLKDFDLAGGRVQVLCVLFTLVLLERVDLDAERHALLSAVLSHGEFCADAVYLHGKQRHGGINTEVTTSNEKVRGERKERR